MNRRILLIDADSAFHTSVAKQLARFRFDILHEAEGDRAHAVATADLPALILVGVEEPDKLGFKVFQKLRKGATSKVPIMLVTSSMTPESFAKHRALKVHADDYLDKRTQADQLLGKIEQLIGLGEPVEDDIDIPLEVDEIPLAEGDMVLEETIGEDDLEEFDEPHGAIQPAIQAKAPPPAPAAGSDNEFDDAHSVGTRNMQVDQLVDAEIDAGFAAMFGDDPAPEAIAPVAAPAPTHDEDSRVRAPIDVSNESVPVAIQDGGRREDPEPEHEQPVEAIDDAFDSFEEEPARPPSGSRAPVAIDDDVPIMSRDMIPIEELAAQADAEEDRGESTKVEIAPLEPPKRSQPATVPAPPMEDSDANEFSQHDMVTRAAPVNPKLLEELSIPVAVAHVNRSTGDTMAPPLSRPPPADIAAIDPPTAPPSVLAAREQARSKRESMQPIVDLGLDEVAVRAESEQSGVHDRRSLQRVGELERQLAQLKTELDRARAAATEKAGSSRAGEFVNLREQITARDRELQKAKDELAAREREVKDAQDKARQAIHARATLETKANELDQLRTNDVNRIAALEGREKTLAGQVAALKDELDARSAAAANAEQTRLQIERDLAAERARAAAGASDAERSLRLEREQLIGRHQGEIASLRGEAEKLRDAALASQRAEFEAETARAVASAIEIARKSAQADLDKLKAQLAAAHATELDGLKQQYGQELASLEKEHADAVARAGAELEAKAAAHAEALAQAGASTEQLRSQHAAALAALASEHAQQLADHQEEQAILATRAQEAHAAELARVKQEHEVALSAATKSAAAADAVAAAEIERTHATHAAEIERVRAAHAAELDQARGAAEAARAEGDKAVAAKTHAHGAELDRLRAEHAQALAARATEHTAELDRLRAAIEAARSEDEQALSDQAAAHAQQLAAHTAQHTEALAATKAELDRQAAQHAEALAAAGAELELQAAAHEVVLEVARGEVSALATAHEAAKAELAEGHRRATEALTAAHGAELQKVAEDRQRAIDEIQKAAAEHRAATERVKREADEELARQREAADREASESRAALLAAKRTAEEAAARHQADRDATQQAHDKAIAEQKAQHERALALAHGDFVKQKAVADADHTKAIAAAKDELERLRSELEANHQRAIAEMQRERDELQKGLSGARETNKRIEGELASAVQTIADRNAELRGHVAAIAERDQRLVELRKELDSLEAENASYQEQVLRAYQKIKTDEAMVARAKKAMAIALTVLDDQGNPSS